MEAGAFGLEFQPSTIKHEKAGSNVFAEKTFAENTLLGHSYGIFFYRKLPGNITTSRTYGEDFLSVTENQLFMNSANFLHLFAAVDRSKEKYWINAAAWCVKL